MVERLSKSFPGYSGSNLGQVFRMAIVESREAYLGSHRE